MIKSAATTASVWTDTGPPVPDRLVADAEALALPLGGTLPAAEIVAAAVVPAVAVTATGAVAEAEVLPPDDCARDADADSTTVTATAASITAAARGNDSFLLDNTSHSSLSSGAPLAPATVTEALAPTHHPNGLVLMDLASRSRDRRRRGDRGPST
jgi:hypothetical protein